MDDSLIREKEIKENILSAYTIIQSYFSLLDIAFLVGLLIFTKFNMNYFPKMIYIINLDIFIRLINIFIYESYGILEDFILSSLAAVQFFFILSILNQCFELLITSYSKVKIFANWEIILFVFLFALDVFLVEKIISLDPQVIYYCSLFKYVVELICAYFFYKYINNKFTEAFNNEKGNIKNIYSKDIILNLSKGIFYWCIIKTMLSFVKLMKIQDAALSYLEVTQIGLSEAIKYGVFVILIVFNYLGENNDNTNTNNQSDNKSTTNLSVE